MDSPAKTKEKRFQAMVLPHLDAAFNLARWLARNNQDAEEIVQESYLRAYRFFDGFHGEDGRAWVLGIVRNTFYTWYRRNKSGAQNSQFEDEVHSAANLDHGAAMSANNPEYELIQKDCQRQMQHALEALPVEFREVMILRELEELSYKQIAGITGIPIGTVMSRLGRGRKQLAEILAAGK
jgi:RNA polymerase sigma factor (sigma-70 family)